MCHTNSRPDNKSSIMKVHAISEPSYCAVTDIAEEIEALLGRLRDTTGEEAVVRKALGTVFIQKKNKAPEAIRRAQSYLTLINDEQARVRETVERESDAANEVAHRSKVRFRLIHYYKGSINLTQSTDAHCPDEPHELIRFIGSIPDVPTSKYCGELAHNLVAGALSGDPAGPIQDLHHEILGTPIPKSPHSSENSPTRSICKPV